MANLPISRSPGKKNDPNKNIAYSPLDTSDTSSQPTNNQSAIDIINVPRPSRRQQRAIQIQIPNFQYNSFIFIITIIQIVIFLVTEAFRLKLTDQKDFRCVLYEFGSKFTPAIVTFHHFHRLFCPIFLHSGLRHLFFNLLSQIFCGFRLEKYYGTKKLMLIYLLAGVGGNLYSAIKNPHATSVGASSALFGLVALRIAYMLENYNQLGPRMKFRLLWLAFIVLGNIEGGRRSDHIDNAAHIGGFIVGALCVVIFKKESQNPNFYKFKILAGALLTVFLMGCFGFIMNMEGLGKEANKLSDHCHKVFNI